MLMYQPLSYGIKLEMSTSYKNNTIEKNFHNLITFKGHHFGPNRQASLLTATLFLFYLDLKLIRYEIIKKCLR